MNGKVLEDSQRGISLNVIDRHIGYVRQQEPLFPHLNISDNLNYGWLRYLKRNNNERDSYKNSQNFNGRSYFFR